MTDSTERMERIQAVTSASSSLSGTPPRTPVPTAADVGAIERELGVPCSVWDTVDPLWIIAAAWKHYPAAPSSSETGPR